MVPAVGNAPILGVPMRNGTGAGSVAAEVGRPEMHGDNPGGDRGKGFGSVMTAALADVPQHHAAMGARQLQKSVADAKESAARDVAPDTKDKVASGEHEADVKAAKAVGAPAETAKVLPGTARSSDESTDATSVAQIGNPVPDLMAIAKPATQGLQVLHAATQSDTVTNINAQIPEVKSPVQTSADPAGQPDATENKEAKPDSKKADAKDSEAKPAMIASNAMMLSVAAAAAPAPTASSKITAVGSHSSAKGGGGAVTAASTHDAVTAGAIVAKNIVGAIPQSVIAADARTSGAHAEASATRSMDGKSNTAPAPASGAVRSSTLVGTLTAGVAANPGAGVQPTGHASLDVQHATAQGLQSVTIPGAPVPGVKAMTATGTANSGALPGNGFTAALLNGHPGTAQATVQPQGHPAAAGSSATAANPYARMDETHAPSLVYASPQKMSVAVSDPLLGNFQVRAQNAGAQVAASLATASVTTHAQLSGQLPSLTAFLQEQRVNLPRVTVVQQSMLGGDSGARGFGGEQQERSGSSGSRGTRAQRGRVDAVGTSTGVSAMSGAGELLTEAGARDETAVASSVRPRDGIHGTFSYVDVHA